MLVERSELLIKTGSEDEFAKIMADKGLKLLASFDGVNSIRFGRGVENPGKFLLLVEWETMEAHNAFRDDPKYPEFRSVLAPFTTGGSMEHFDMD